MGRPSFAGVFRTITDPLVQVATAPYHMAETISRDTNQTVRQTVNVGGQVGNNLINTTGNVANNVTDRVGDVADNALKVFNNPLIWVGLGVVAIVMLRR
jgi:hypothetical protein